MSKQTVLGIRKAKDGRLELTDVSNSQAVAGFRNKSDLIQYLKDLILIAEQNNEWD